VSEPTDVREVPEVPEVPGPDGAAVAEPDGAAVPEPDDAPAADDVLEPDDDELRPDFDPLAALGMQVDEPDPAPADDARARLAPADEAGPAPLGRLADLACWWAGVRGDGRAGPPRQVLLVGASDRHGPQRDGVRRVPLPSPTTLLPYDDDYAEDDPGDAVAEAISWGTATADEAADGGVELVVLSVDDPEATRALAADLLGLDAVEASGWPQDRGLTDEAWMAEVAALRDRLRPLRDLRDRPAEALRALDAPVTAGAAALLLQAAVRRTPVLLDGPGAAAAGLLARRVSYRVTDWWQAAHEAPDPLHERALASLGLTALTRLDIAVEDGTAALVGLAVLERAAVLLDPGLDSEPAA